MGIAATSTQTGNCFNTDEAKAWFNGLIDTIRTDQLKLEINLASKEERDFYHTVMFGNDLEMVKNMRGFGIRVYVTKMLGDFVKEIVSKKIRPVNLAFSYNHDSLLCWAEIKEGDDKIERDLILSKAKVNSKYSEHGFTLSLTIVSEEDNIPIPTHYNVIKRKD